MIGFCGGGGVLPAPACQLPVPATPCPPPKQLKPSAPPPPGQACTPVQRRRPGAAAGPLGARILPKPFALLRGSLAPWLRPCSRARDKPAMVRQLRQLQRFEASSCAPELAPAFALTSPGASGTQYYAQAPALRAMPARPSLGSTRVNCPPLRLYWSYLPSQVATLAGAPALRAKPPRARPHWAPLESTALRCGLTTAVPGCYPRWSSRASSHATLTDTA